MKHNHLFMTQFSKTLTISDEFQLGFLNLSTLTSYWKIGENTIPKKPVHDKLNKFIMRDRPVRKVNDLIGKFFKKKEIIIIQKWRAMNALWLPIIDRLDTLHHLAMYGSDKTWSIPFEAKLMYAIIGTS